MDLLIKGNARSFLRSGNVAWSGWFLSKEQNHKDSEIKRNIEE